MPNNLLIDQTLAQIETALLRELTFAFRRNCMPSPATPAALRAVPAMHEGMPVRTDLDMVYVTSLGARFYWWQASTAADDGATVLAPLDAGVTGRWLIVTSTLLLKGIPLANLTDGFLREVILHNGDFDEQVLQSRIYGRAPCVAIHIENEVHKAISQIPGALYDYRVRAQIWSVSRNYRDGYEAAIGSPLPDEADADPGVLTVHGRVKQFLAGSNIGIDSITHTEIMGGNQERSSTAERSFVWSLDIEIRGSVDNPDAPIELDHPSVIYAQRARAGANADGTFDLANAILSGCDVSPGLGMSTTIAGGTAKINGVPVTVSPLVYTFAASSVTYRDLAPNGTWAFVAVSEGEEAPPVASGSLRVGMTTTDAAGIVTDSFVCSVYELSGDPDQISIS